MSYQIHPSVIHFSRKEKGKKILNNEGLCDGLREWKVVNILYGSDSFTVDSHIWKGRSTKILLVIPIHCKDGSMTTQPITTI